MHTPFRSEQEVFRGVVIFAVGAAAVIALALIVDAMAGAILAALLIGLAIGLTLQRSRGSLPQDVEVARGDGSAHRILVVANQTVEGPELLDEIRNRARGRRRVELLVVSPSLSVTRLQRLAGDVDDARDEAEGRLRRSVATLERAGYAVRGRTGDEDPLMAVEDALREFGADEVIVSTLPPETSRWLERGLVGQVRERVDVPVTHVVVAMEPADRAPAAA
jgi:GABA permease